MYQFFKNVLVSFLLLPFTEFMFVFVLISEQQIEAFDYNKQDIEISHSF